MKDSESIEHECALAAAILIVEMVQTSQGATTMEMVSFSTRACLNAVKEARRRALEVTYEPSRN